jgi:hypothetical protein
MKSLNNKIKHIICAISISDLLPRVDALDAPLTTAVAGTTSGTANKINIRITVIASVTLV